MITITVLFCANGQRTFSGIVGNEFPTSEYEQFIWTLGWPIALETHAGFKGNLNMSFCDVAPYYADLYSEVIFHAPILFKETSGSIKGSKDQSLYASHSHGSLNSLLMEPNTGPFIDNEREVITRSDSPYFEKRRARSLSGVYANSRRMHHKIIENDIVIILWIQEKQMINNILEGLPHHYQIVIMVCPQQISLGIYCIRIFMNNFPLEDQCVIKI